MRTALGILAVIIIVAIIYLLLPPATKQSVQFWKPNYSLAPVASPSTSPLAINATVAPFVTATPNPTSGFIAQSSSIPTFKSAASPSVSPKPSSSALVTTTNTSLPGTGDIFRDPIILILGMLASIVAIYAGNKMTKYL